VTLYALARILHPYDEADSQRNAAKEGEQLFRAIPELGRSALEVSQVRIVDIITVLLVFARVENTIADGIISRLDNPIKLFISFAASESS